MNGKLSHAIITLFMCGDVMTGRGIDQILSHPSVPHIFEPFVRDAREYVMLAEGANGPIPRKADFSYIWGDALEEFRRTAPDVRIVNLETSVTASEDYWKGKGINYRMHPENAPVLTTAEIDVCSLANNHVLDWGYGGLTETLETLRKSGINPVGAGATLRDAEAPAIVEIKGKGRVLVFAFGSESSGVPSSWRATAERPGVNLLPDLSERTARAIGERVRKTQRPGDIAIASIHWGGNWGYEIPREHREFAHRLIDVADIDLVHGHSSHHVKGIEVYRDRLVVHGCGDFITDYEGIGGYETFRGDLGLMYFPSVDPATGSLVSLRMVPTRMRNFKVNRASREEASWLADVLNREGKRFGTRVEAGGDGALLLRWK